MASREEVDSTGMRPKMGQETITLPITFDYQGGRREKSKTSRNIAVVLGILGVIVAIAVLFNKNGSFLTNALMSVVVVAVVSFIIRFSLLKEGTLREERIHLEDTDGYLPMTSFWGIYDVSDVYPYICRFRNGKSGVFVLLNRDVILGKYSEAEFDHYEAIGDAYNISGSSNIQMCHLDYMDVVGSDERLDESFKSLSRVSNPDLKDLLTDIYSYQQDMMSKQITTFDAYVFLWSGNDETSWSTVQRILSCFMEANYRSYRVLNKQDLRELPKTIFLLEDFSVEQASLDAFTGENKSSNVVPLSVEHGDGSVEVLNKSSYEKKNEREVSERRQEINKELKNSKKRKKRAKGSNVSAEDLEKQGRDYLEDGEEIDL